MFCECLGEALKRVLDQKGLTGTENGQNLDQSKMFLRELLESRSYLTFIVEFNSAAFVIFSYVCI